MRPQWQPPSTFMRSSLAGIGIRYPLSAVPAPAQPILDQGMEEAMTEEGLRAGAERIVAARAAITKLDGLPDAERPRTVEDGYRMLQIATERWGDEPVGWKVGATSREVQAMFGIAEPVYGPLFRTT